MNFQSKVLANVEAQSRVPSSIKQPSAFLQNYSILVVYHEDDLTITCVDKSTAVPTKSTSKAKGSTTTPTTTTTTTTAKTTTLVESVDSEESSESTVLPPVAGESKSDGDYFQFENCHFYLRTIHFKTLITLQFLIISSTCFPGEDVSAAIIVSVVMVLVVIIILLIVRVLYLRHAR